MKINILVLHECDFGFEWYIAVKNVKKMWVIKLHSREYSGNFTISQVRIKDYSTVTDFAKFLGWSTSEPFSRATW